MGTAAAAASVDAAAAASDTAALVDDTASDVGGQLVVVVVESKVARRDTLEGVVGVFHKALGVEAVTAGHTAVLLQQVGPGSAHQCPQAPYWHIPHPVDCLEARLGGCSLECHR